MTFWGIYWKNCSSSLNNGYLKINFTSNKLPNFQKKKKKKKRKKKKKGQNFLRRERKNKRNRPYCKMWKLLKFRFGEKTKTGWTNPREKQWAR